MSIKYYNLKIDGKFFKNFYDKLEAIKEYRNLEEKEKQIYEVIINDDGTQNEQLISVEDEVPFNEIKWYEIHNTISEWNSTCTGTYLILEKAKEWLKDKEDWYRHRGTGTIYECSINNRDLSVKSKKIFEK